MLNNTWIMKLNSRHSSDHNYYTNGRDSAVETFNVSIEISSILYGNRK